MPNVRNTPPRRRMECPRCGRNISYTHPWTTDFVGGGMIRDFERRVLKEHGPASNRCNGGDTTGFGIYVPKESK